MEVDVVVSYLFLQLKLPESLFRLTVVGVRKGQSEVDGFEDCHIQIQSNKQTVGSIELWMAAV